MSLPVGATLKRLARALAVAGGILAGLLLLLGRLALAQQLWGKAQGYLEASVSLHNSLAAQVELTRLFEQLDRPDDARRHADACVQLALAQAAGT